MAKRTIAEICVALGIPSDLATIDVSSLSKVDISKVSREELMFLSKEIADAQAITVTADKVVDANGKTINADDKKEIGDCFASEYFSFGKMYGTPYERKTNINTPQLCLALIPEILGWEADPDKWDVPRAIYKEPDMDESDIRITTTIKSVWDWVADKIGNTVFRINPELLTGRPVKRAPKGKSAYETYVLDISPKDFIENLTIEEAVGFFNETRPAMPLFEEMRAHLSEGHTFQLKINRKTGRVVFYKKHSSRMCTNLYLG